MVCSKCETKLAKLACPEPWKAGARSVTGGREGGRGESKALSAAKRFAPYASKCGVCRQSLHQAGQFCQTCAYSKGVCAMCGIKILDTTYYRQSGAGDVEAAAAARDKKNAEFAAECAEEAARRSAGGAQQPAPVLVHAAPAPVLVPRLAPGGATDVSFVQHAVFAGARLGYVFTTRVQGTGYYADGAAAATAQAAAAFAAAAAAVGAAAAAGAAGAAAAAGGSPGMAGAGAAAAELATSSIAPRNDPKTLAAMAAARHAPTGGLLSSGMGAAGRVALAKPELEPGAPPPGWGYDAGSGYYFDAKTQQYYDPQRRLFFDCKSNSWSAVQAGAPGPRTRVVDKWGL